MRNPWCFAISRVLDLRHSYASLLIAQGLNVVYVSRQLAHASPDITLKVYSHLFDQAEHGQRASDALEAAFAKTLQKSGGEQRQTGEADEPPKVAQLRASANGVD